jgi:hypothetical protein
VDRYLLTSFSPLSPSSGSVPICATLMVTPSRNPFPVEKGPVCATWAGTFSRPSLLSSPSYLLTHPEVDSSDGESTPPREPRRAVQPCLASRDFHRILRPATCTASCVPRPATAPRRTTRAVLTIRGLRPPDILHCAPGVVLSPAIHSPTYPCDPLFHFPCDPLSFFPHNSQYNS